jgi:hypothetical protein
MSVGPLGRRRAAGGTNEVRISPKNQNPSKVCRTPRAAEEVMWVTGEVTLTESNPATPMRKPKQPCEAHQRDIHYISNDVL